MSSVVLVTSGKGGTGKTTFSLLLSNALYQKGKNVLLVELDSGLRGLDIMLGVSDKVVFDLSDVLNGRCTLDKAVVICKAEVGNLHLIAAPFDRMFSPKKEQLLKLLKGLSGCYDFLILDTAAGLGKAFDCAAYSCDTAIVISNVDAISARDAAGAVRLLQKKPTRLVINKFKREYLSNFVPHLDYIIDEVKAQLLGVIPQDSTVAAMSQGANIIENSPAAKEVEDIANRLLGQRVPLNMDRLK